MNHCSHSRPVLRLMPSVRHSLSKLLRPHHQPVLNESVAFCHQLGVLPKRLGSVVYQPGSCNRRLQRAYARTVTLANPEVTDRLPRHSYVTGGKQLRSIHSKEGL